MLEILTPPIKALILDMDGVLYRDKDPLVDLPRAFKIMEEKGLKVMLATNNTTKTASQFAEKMGELGVRLDPEQIINSPMAAADMLYERFPQGGPVYVFGEEGLRKTLESRGFYHSEDNVQAVVVGLDRQVNFDKLKKVTTLIRSGLPFIGTNPDNTFPMPDGIVIPGTGPFLAFFEASTDVKPTVAGKPFPFLFNLALKRLGTPANQTLAIGDRLETDVVGAYRAGCRTGLVLTGVSTREEADNFDPRPDLIASDLMEILNG